MGYKTGALCALALVSSMGMAASQAPTERGMEQLDRMMKKRHVVQNSVGPTSTPVELRAALVRFDAVLAELDDPAMRDLANGNHYLRNEHLNVLIPKAEVYARLGMKEKALDALERSQDSGWYPFMEGWATKPDFASLRDEPRFKAVLARAKIGKDLFRTPAHATAYKDKLSVEERIAGLSAFWHEARENFVYFDRVPGLEWDKVYLDYLGKVIAAETTREYYEVLMRLAPLLEDGHTNIYPPKELFDTFYARPPVRTALVEDKVLVTRIDSPSLDTQLRVGDEIIAIDGMPVKDYAKKDLAPYASSSTPQDREVRMFAYQLLAGSADRNVALTVAGADGKRREVSLARKGYTDLRKYQPFQFKMLKGDVAYISLDHFESEDGVKAFEAALPAIMKARALVIDVRQNGGGSSWYGQQILKHLSNKPIVAAASYVRVDSGFERARRGSQVNWMRIDEPDTSPPRTNAVFSGPVAVLTGPRTFSAAEDFLLSFDLLERGKIVGEASGGSTGQPLFFDLPGGGRARICVKRDTYPDGRALVGKGVTPHVSARPSVKDVRNGEDPVLAKALEVLSQPGPLSKSAGLAGKRL